jgi:hypothetical protein
MKFMFEMRKIHCPYCGELQLVDLDGSGGDQNYWEDCQVCCSPILFRLHVDTHSGALAVHVHRDDD